MQWARLVPRRPWLAALIRALGWMSLRTIQRMRRRSQSLEPARQRPIPDWSAQRLDTMGRKRQKPAQSLCPWRLPQALGNHWMPPARLARHLTLVLRSWRLAPFPDASWTSLCSSILSGADPLFWRATYPHNIPYASVSRLQSSAYPATTAIWASRRVYHNQAAAHKTRRTKGGCERDYVCATRYTVRSPE